MAAAKGVVNFVRAFTTVYAPPDQVHERGNFYFGLDGCEVKFLVKNDTVEKMGAQTVINILCSYRLQNSEGSISYDENSKTGEYFQVYEVTM